MYLKKINKFDITTSANERKDLLTLGQYETIAITTIRRVHKNNSRKFLLNYELLSHIMFEMMKGDLRYDPTKGTSRRTWRFKCAEWSLKSYTREMAKYKKRTPIGPYDSKLLKRAENISIIDKLVLFDAVRNSELEKQEKEFIIRHYFENETLTDISKSTKINRQQVCRCIKTATKKLKIDFGVFT